MPAKKEISLLPDQENANSPVNKVIRWLTTVGRVVIIITELVVVSAFFSRFWLDRKNSDLSEILRQQKAILESTQDFEKQYNLLQQRLKAVGDYYKKDPSLSVKLQTISDSTPLNVSIQNINIDTTKNDISASITSVAYQEESIVDFIVNLSLNPEIKTVDVKKIEKKPKDEKYYVEVVLVFKNSSTAKT